MSYCTVELTMLPMLTNRLLTTELNAGMAATAADSNPVGPHSEVSFPWEVTGISCPRLTNTYHEGRGSVSGIRYTRSRDRS